MCHGDVYDTHGMKQPIQNREPQTTPSVRKGGARVPVQDYLTTLKRV